MQINYCKMQIVKDDANQVNILSKHHFTKATHIMLAERLAENPTHFLPQLWQKILTSPKLKVHQLIHNLIKVNDMTLMLIRDYQEYKLIIQFVNGYLFANPVNIVRNMLFYLNIEHFKIVTD